MGSNFNKIYEESLKNPEEFWKKISEDVFWFKKPTKVSVSYTHLTLPTTPYV